MLYPRLLLLLACLGPWSAQAEDAAARVLFINSYNRGYTWSDGIEDGLRQRLAQSGKKIELSLEYLDSRRFGYGAQIEPLAQSMAAKYIHYRPDVVVVSDNAAFDFAIKYRPRLFPEQPIVFTGYNNFRPDVLQGLSNITGVNEEVAVADTVAMALKVQPKTRTLAFVVSTADASSKRISEVAEQSVFPKLRERFEVVVFKDASVQEIRQGLAALPRETILILSGQSRDAGAGRELTPAEHGRLITAASPFPAYTFWDFHLQSGAIGGHIITGPDQGAAAADMALKILGGTTADSIPVLMTTPTQDIFDYPVMERFGVKPGDLPAGAQIINRPHSLWDQYRWQVTAGLALLVVETALIALLLRVARGRRRALGELAQERALLEHRVTERTAELRAANEQLGQLSALDGLTGLANRRCFDDALVKEISRMQRSGGVLSLMLLDVDFFKNYNDSLGHVAGDECLRRVAALLMAAAARQPDLAARYGGEEFAVILPETDAQGAASVAEHVRAGVERLGMPHPSSDISDHVTVSIGVATIAGPTLPTAQELVQLADQRLYQAKRAGRNRVI